MTTSRPSTRLPDRYGITCSAQPARTSEWITIRPLKTTDGFGSRNRPDSARQMSCRLPSFANVALIMLSMYCGRQRCVAASASEPWPSAERASAWSPARRSCSIATCPARPSSVRTAGNGARWRMCEARSADRRPASPRPCRAWTRAGDCAVYSVSEGRLGTTLQAQRSAASRQLRRRVR